VQPAPPDDGFTSRIAEFMVLLGPWAAASRCVADDRRLELISSGTVSIDGRVVNQVPAFFDIAMVFQSYALYPHMSVHTISPFCAGAMSARRDRAARGAGQVTLSELLERKPCASGGQRAWRSAPTVASQAVSVRRAVIEPDAALRVTSSSGSARSGPHRFT
jgi:multiple sugar transport system ATP-binding protein